MFTTHGEFISYYSKLKTEYSLINSQDNDYCCIFAMDFVDAVDSGVLFCFCIWFFMVFTFSVSVFF